MSLAYINLPVYPRILETWQENLSNLEAYSEYGKFLVWSEYYNEFGIYQPSRVSTYLRNMARKLK